MYFGMLQKCSLILILIAFMTYSKSSVVTTTIAAPTKNILDQSLFMKYTVHLHPKFTSYEVRIEILKTFGIFQFHS